MVRRGAYYLLHGDSGYITRTIEPQLPRDLLAIIDSQPGWYRDNSRLSDSTQAVGRLNGRRCSLSYPGKKDVVCDWDRHDTSLRSASALNQFRKTKNLQAGRQSR